MSATRTLLLCNFSTIIPPPIKLQNNSSKNLSSFYQHQQSTIIKHPSSNPNPKPSFVKPILYSSSFVKKGHLQICFSSFNKQDSSNSKENNGVSNVPNGGEGEQQGGRDWTTSILLFVLWGVLLYYVFNLSPNQTPSRDMYFLKKLLNLKGDDGFRMNEVLISLWYIMGLWPLVYSMILLPTARSSNSKIPLWPFLVLSCFGGAYALLPYFVIWTPPPPPVDQTELEKWPLTFLESKITAGISLAAGIALIGYAALADAGVWAEFYQYFRESKFIHVTCIDFTLLSTFAPFWVYNDMTARKWYDQGSWLLPVSLVPVLGPALYLLLRPSLSTLSLIEQE